MSGSRLVIDSNVLIDFYRGRIEAQEFLRGLQDRPFLSAVTVGELYAGVREGLQRMILDRMVLGYRVLPIGRDVAVQGGLFVKQYGRSHGVQLADALIGATALNAGCTLVTLNTKHFPMVPATSLVRPY